MAFSLSTTRRFFLYSSVLCSMIVFLRGGFTVKIHNKLHYMHENYAFRSKISYIVKDTDKKSEFRNSGHGVKVLDSGYNIPLIGFGTAGLGAQTKEAVLKALELGYRLIDSAQAREWYREDLVGEALDESSVYRHELFIVSKIHPRNLTRESCWDCLRKSLKDLKTNYLDLLLIHYPDCFEPICDPSNSPGTWQECWGAMQDMYEEGLVRSLGVSNFGEDELLSLLRTFSVKPSVVQRNSDPLRADRKMQKLCREKNITFMGYSSLGSQWQFSKLNKNPVVLKWALSKGQVVIPRSSNPDHMRENLNSISCPLRHEDIEAIDSLDGSDPQ